MFCAICTSDRGPFVTRPLGKGNALVRVCASCDEEPAREKRGREYAYEAPELPTGFSANVRAAYRRITDAPSKFVRSGSLADTRTPNTILVRVPIRCFARRRDMREACATFADQPWAREARYLGTSDRYHMFERHDPKFTAASRRVDLDVIAALEALAGRSQVNSTWILDLLDRELPALTGAERDRLAEAVVAALPAHVIVTAICSSAAAVLKQRGIDDFRAAHEIARNAAQHVLLALHPIVDELDNEGAFVR